MMQTPEPTPPYGHPSEEGIGSVYFIPYEPHLKELARQLRQNMTPGEVILWQHLKKRQMCGLSGAENFLSIDQGNHLTPDQTLKCRFCAGLQLYSQ